MILARLADAKFTVVPAGQPVSAISCNFIVIDRKDCLTVPDWTRYEAATLKTRLMPGGLIFYYQDPGVPELLQVTTGMVLPPQSSLLAWEFAISNRQFEEKYGIDIELLAQRVAEIIGRQTRSE